MGRKTKHILVIRLSAMGDVAMTVPVVRSLVAQHKVKVTVVSRASYRPFFEDIPKVNFFEAHTEGRHKGFFGLLRLYRDLKKLHVYAVADLHNVLRSKIITKLFSLRGKKTATVDKARKEKAALTSHDPAKKIFEPLLPTTERYAKVFEAIGFPVDLHSHTFPEKKSLSVDILELTGPKNGTWIGIAPFAQHSGKIYPRKEMQKVIEALAAQPDYTLMLFGGGRHEVSQLKKYARERNNIVVVAGKLNLKQELKLIPHLDLMLSMDSSNAHIAAMLGVKVITLWGATHPYTGFAPFGQPVDYAITADREKYPLLPTSVYGNKKVKGYEDAMATIAPATIVNKIKEVLE
ncbi:glycosyltransferase family 9 protein [Flavobacterium sp. MFBS3-15]|uniref:glycosyltransferase family 9 protein n=1 Tax=Flavobacterium sp. MFBS3-15 TaxID=2989816 RepID=UPI0022369383|nr:glycosyltransferase family 9 protein [Flavobacterium sp. MFBS3-15]MCW4469166.1 glycosyltransferase family 9 protein [Flavobacterium sp. MFBS3-15]